MTDRPFEDRVTRWYRDRAGVEPVPSRLRARVLALPEQVPLAPRWSLQLRWGPRSAVLVVAFLVALLVALALTAAGMVPRLFPDRTLVFPANLDACTVLRKAVTVVDPPYVDGDHGMTAWGAHVCVNDGWDGSYEDRHLFLRMQPTTFGEARAIIDDPVNWAEALPDEDGYTGLPAVWRIHSPGVWAGNGAADADRDRGMVALAVSREPFFFIVTGRDPSRVIEDAAAVAGTLGVEFGDVARYEWPPIPMPVPTMWRP